MTSWPLLELSDSILYVSALLADQPRAIDRVIDYFGGANPAPPDDQHHARFDSARRLRLLNEVAR